MSKKQTEEENTEEYWNEQRAKLGLKPLEKWKVIVFFKFSRLS
jgi:hypothetical protein